MPLTEPAFQRCINPDCSQKYPVAETLTACPACGGLLDIEYDWNRLPVPRSLREIEARWGRRNEPLEFSGVWRFRQLLPFAPDDKIVTIGEEQTILQKSRAVAGWCGMSPGNLFLQYEGLNPSGSFKDNGMTAAVTLDHMVGAKIAACASTGNTSASLAIYASTTRLFKVIVFVGSGKIAYGKLSQALDYGAKTIQLQGDFDDAMRQVQDVCRHEKIYLCNSVNPFRLEGQKTIIFRILESLRWEVPDWIVVPGGNLGNSSAFGKALGELKHLGLIDRVPRLAIINASGANTLYQLHQVHGLRWSGGRRRALIPDPHREILRRHGSRRPARVDSGHGHSDQSAGESAQGSAGAGGHRWGGAASDRPGNSRRQSADRGGRFWLRAGECRQRRRCAALTQRRGHRAQRSGRHLLF